MSEQDADILQKLWGEHEAVPSPKGFGGRDINGIDLVMLDADIAGCISVYLDRETLEIV